MLQNKLQEASREASRKRLHSMLAVGAVALVLGLGLVVATQYYEIGELRRGQSDTPPVAEVPASPEPPAPPAQRLSAAPLPEPDRPETVQAPNGSSPPFNAADRDAFKAALRRFEVETEPQIRAQNFADWRSEKQKDILFLKEAAVSAFATGDYGEAVAQLQKAQDLAQHELDAFEAAFEEAFGAARKSRETDDYETAQAHIDAALRLNPGSEEAQVLADDIAQLPKVLEWLRAAEIARAENNRKAELENLSEVLKRDPARPGIAERASLLAKEIKERAFAGHIQIGMAEVEAQQLEAAEGQLAAARKLYPKRAETGLLSARVDELKSNLETKRLLELAQQAIAADDWLKAQDLFEKAQQIQPRNQQVQDGLTRARDIISMGQQISNHLNAPERLSSDNVASGARHLLAKAGPLSNSSPSLDARVKALADLLASYAIKVPVRVISDAQTAVSVRGVGRVGAIREKVIELKPGAYTFEGKRNGYKSKLLRVQIPPGNKQVTVSIICDEPI